MPLAPGVVILNDPAQSSITIMPMLMTRKGILRSFIHAANLVNLLSAPVIDVLGLSMVVSFRSGTATLYIRLIASPPLRGSRSPYRQPRWHSSSACSARRWQRSPSPGHHRSRPSVRSQSPRPRDDRASGRSSSRTKPERAQTDRRRLHDAPSVRPHRPNQHPSPRPYVPRRNTRTRSPGPRLGLRSRADAPSADRARASSTATGIHQEPRKTAQAWQTGSGPSPGSPSPARGWRQPCYLHSMKQQGQYVTSFFSNLLGRLSAHQEPSGDKTVL